MEVSFHFHCLIAATVCLLVAEFIIYPDFHAFIVTFFTALCLLINVQEEIEAPMWVDFTVEAKSSYQDV